MLFKINNKIVFPILNGKHINLYYTPPLIATGVCGDNVEWTLWKDGTLELSGTGNMYSLSSAEGYSYYNHKDSVISIIINEGITSIGKQAFYNYNTVNSLSLPNTLSRIEASSIILTSLEICTIPSSVTYIGSWAISARTPIINYMGTVEQWATLNLDINGLGRQSLYEFRIQNVKIENLTISSLTTIAKYTFRYQGNLKKVYLIGNVQSIGTEAFARCGNLEEVVLGDNVTTIEATAFSTSDGRKKVTFGANISIIKDYAFSSCPNCLLYDFRNYGKNTIPTLQNTRAFLYINDNAKIVVPDALYDDWIVSSNWVTYAAYIVKESEYVD